MPSFTFVSTANAFVLRGATPVFVDIRPDTLNLDESLIEAAITPRTRAIVAGPLRRRRLRDGRDPGDRAPARPARDRGRGAGRCIAAIEGRPLGTHRRISARSAFTRPRTSSAGEGGALLVNDARCVERAEIIREKGTDRSQFFRGQVDKYTWVDVGSSYLPERADRRVPVGADWRRPTTSRAAPAGDLAMRYHDGARDARGRERLRGGRSCRRDCAHNAHMFYLLLPRSRDAHRVSCASLNERGDQRRVPLRAAAFVARRTRFGRAHGPLRTPTRQRTPGPAAVVGGARTRRRRSHRRRRRADFRLSRVLLLPSCPSALLITSAGAPAPARARSGCS